ncbi:MAG: multidrug effflux MFS transporter [Gammaproteobacteria bacterium]|nr:multidrug effflux MFS transporter [Gammaproteobacteria bacterium]
MLKTKTLPPKIILLFSILFVSIGTASSDLYLPSLPAIASSLGSTIALVQLSVAMFMLGFTPARLFVATISDAIGRKIPLLFSLMICLLGSLYCLYAVNIHALLFGRLLQGFGAGGSSVLARVILRDSVADKRLAEYSSYFSMVGITLMAGAPLIGGYLQHYFGWHASFYLLSGYSVFALLIGIFFLPETNQHRNIKCLKPAVLALNCKNLFDKRSFIIYGLLLFFGYGSMVAWLTSGTVVLQEVLALTPIDFGWCAAAVGACYFAAAFINSRFVGRFGIQKMLTLGISCLLLGSIAMLIPVLVFNWLNPILFVVPVMLAIFGIGMITPNSYAAGLMPFAKIAGMAAAVLASIQTLGGVFASIAISLSSDHNQLPLGLVLFVSGLACMVLLKLLSVDKSKS